MEQIVYTLNKTKEPVYANFKTRIAASFIDVLILSPLTFGLVHYNLMHIKSFILSATLSFVPIIYKCWMEKNYGATFGKKIMKIAVVSEKLDNLSYQEVFSRNYYYFLAVIIALSSNYYTWTMSEFQLATTFSEAWELDDMQPLPYKIRSYVFSSLIIIDCLIMLMNYRNQTLHDLLGKTLVIETSSR